MVILTSSTLHTTLAMVAMKQSYLSVVSLQLQQEHLAGGSPCAQDH
jgi:hypothetical protein